MKESNIKTLKNIFEKINTLKNDEDSQASFSSLKAEFENLSGNVSFVRSRVKAPISIINKFKEQEDEYGKDPLRLKDMVGFMVIVDSNKDVDNVLEYITKNYSDIKNPFSRTLFHDYRKDDFVKDKNSSLSKDLIETFNLNNPSETDKDLSKGYQTSDGYKNVRVNIVCNSYPTEIQVKTKAQYIAHQATHDAVYKSSQITNEQERMLLVSKMFPYFESLAYYQLNCNNLSNIEKEHVIKDINAVYERNNNIFKMDKYSPFYNAACKSFAINSFILNNQATIFGAAVLDSEPLNLKLVESEVERVFAFTKNDYQVNNPSKSDNESFQNAINLVSKMTYTDFVNIKENIYGEYKLDSCVISGNWDLLRKPDIKIIDKFSKNFKHVNVKLYDDELSELVTGKKPIFSEDKRAETVSNLRGVSSVSMVGTDGSILSHQQIQPLAIVPATPKQYHIGYLPGVFDMLHPGHMGYIERASQLCDKLIVGQKSDEYVRVMKNKEPVLKGEERNEILASLRCVDEVIETDMDITPTDDILQEMKECCKNPNNKCAIFVGSDWINKPETKGERSLKELENLKTNYSEIELINLPRNKETLSSSEYRKQALDIISDKNPYEVMAIGEITSEQ